MDNDKDKVEEPRVLYQKRQRLTFFSSFDEERQAQYAYWMSMTYEQRFEEHRKLSIQIYSGCEKYCGNRLTFD